jgi:hypothetical protein
MVLKGPFSDTSQVKSAAGRQLAVERPDAGAFRLIIL